MKACLALSLLFLGRICCDAAGSNIVHQASGIIFPASIERFQRGTVKEDPKDSKKVEVHYNYPSGVIVIVSVYPAPADAKGPTLLDGDARSDATPAFSKEFNRIKAKLVNADFRMVEEGRFHAALQKKGPVGMKATLKGTGDNLGVNQDFVLCERNGFFVEFTVTYPSSQWIEYAVTYTDVAHFIVWPDQK